MPQFLKYILTCPHLPAPFPVLCFLFLFASCEKVTQWELHPDTEKYLIVEGMVTDEYKNQSIKLSSSTVALNEKPVPVSGAEITITCEDSVVSLVENPGSPGIYETEIKYTGEPGKSYLLNILHNGKGYHAEAMMEFNTFIRLLRYAPSGETGMYQLTWVANAYNIDHPAMYEVVLDWTGVPGYENIPAGDCMKTLYFYTLPTLDISEVFAPDFEKISFPEGTTITEKKFSLSKEHTEYLRALLSETTWRGGYFDSAPANVPTNLSQGALGFFSACSVTTVSFKVTP